MDKVVKLNVDDNIFMKIKKNKKIIYILDKDENLFKKNQRLVVVNNKNNKILKTKIVKVYQQCNIDELKNILKRKSKYIYPKDFNSDKVVTAIQFKCNKKIIRKIILFVILLFLCIYGFFFIKNTLSSYKDKKVTNQIEEIKKDKISYVVVSINPKIIIELKNDKVTNTGCLNEDCINLFNKINITNQNLKSAIENLYEVAKNSGVDVSNGVLVSSKDDIQKELENLNYVEYNKIDNKEETIYIKQIIGNSKIKESKQDYNKKLLETYQKDNDYGKYYTCVINDELECYLTDEFAEKFSYLLSFNSSEEETLKTIIFKTLEFDPILQRILDKFNVKYKKETFFGIKGITEIKINNNYYTLMTSVSTELSSVGASFEIRDAEYGVIVLKLQNFNLCNSSYKEEDLIELPIGVVEIN